MISCLCCLGNFTRDVKVKETSLEDGRVESRKGGKEEISDFFEWDGAVGAGGEEDG